MSVVPFRSGSAPDRRERRELAADRAFLASERAADGRDLIWRLRTGMGLLGLGTAAVSPLVDIASGLPVIEFISWDDGPNPVVVMNPPPGFMKATLDKAAVQLAEVVGVRRIVFDLIEHHRIRATLLRTDPLSDVCRVVRQGDGLVMLGVGEDGRPVVVDPRAIPHVIAQGATRAGKSSMAYTMLAQMAPMLDVDVRFSDPTGLLVRPWAPRQCRVGGLSDVGAHVKMLREAVAEMERRLPLIPDDRDELPTSIGLPLIVVVMEEYPGLLRAADQLDKAFGREIRACVSRLLAESWKVGMRVWMLVQRAEANLVGGFERSNLQFRVSFRVDNVESVKLLHTDPPLDVVLEHVTAPAGVALLSGPGITLRRVRVALTVYADYASQVRMSGR